jgi:ribosome-associated toxin RatA of RatAB toxin-antitoxin module
MPKLNFSVNIPSPPQKLMEILLDHQNWYQFFQYLKNVSVIDKTENEITTQEEFGFVFHRLSHKIQQQTIFKIKDYSIEAKIVSGPLKNTTSKITFEPLPDGSKVNVYLDWNVSFKYKFLMPIIKPRIKNMIIAILFKAHTVIAS